MNGDNKKNFIEESSTYITNLNRALKNIKSDIMVNFVWSDQAGIVIMTNKVAFFLDLQTIKNYIKNINHINADRVKVPRLPQSKSYLKIIGIFYLQENLITSITSSVVEGIIKNNHIFDNIILASKPYIIKVSSKSDMFII